MINSSTKTIIYIKVRQIYEMKNSENKYLVDVDRLRLTFYIYSLYLVNIIS